MRSKADETLVIVETLICPLFANNFTFIRHEFVDNCMKVELRLGQPQISKHLTELQFSVKFC